MLNFHSIDNNWTLFLDRDGVINEDKSPYTLRADEFEFYRGVPVAIAGMSKIFRYIFVVTNQRGVGKQLMTESDLLHIHNKMVAGIEKAGGRIDKIYYCTSLENSHPDRKPNPGMALNAIREHPEVLPEKSVMIGNNISDMQFGKNAGLHTVLVNTTGTKVKIPHPLVDMQYPTFPDFANALINGRKDFPQEPSSQNIV